MISPAQLAAIREREQKATPGPWLVPEPTAPMTCVYAERRNVGLCLERDDAFFIAHARTDIPLLLAALEEQARELEAVTSARESIASYFEHLSRVQIGIIDLTGTPAHEFYATIAAWVRNRLDVTWAEEARAALAGGEEG